MLLVSTIATSFVDSDKESADNLDGRAEWIEPLVCR